MRVVDVTISIDDDVLREASFVAVERQQFYDGDVGAVFDGAARFSAVTMSVVPICRYALFYALYDDTPLLR